MKTKRIFLAMSEIVGYTITDDSTLIMLIGS